MNTLIYEVCSKSSTNFELPRVTYIRFSISFLDKFGHFKCSLNFWLCFACMCFGSFSIFAYSKKGIKESYKILLLDSKTKLTPVGHNWWLILGFWLWCGNQSSIIPMEAGALTKTEKTRQIRWNANVLLIVFYHCRGVVHYELLPWGWIVN